MEKGSTLSPPWIYLVLLEKNKVYRKYQNFIRGDPYELVKRLFDGLKFQKSNIFLEGSWHPNFMNPFEYGKSCLGKSVPTRIGTQTPPNPKIQCGHNVPSPPGSLIHQNRPGQIELSEEDGREFQFLIQSHKGLSL